jgi:hypothetical protein
MDTTVMDRFVESLACEHPDKYDFYVWRVHSLDVQPDTVWMEYGSEGTVKLPTPTDPNRPHDEYRPGLACGHVGGAAAAGAFAAEVGASVGR